MSESIAASTLAGPVCQVKRGDLAQQPGYAMNAPKDHLTPKLVYELVSIQMSEMDTALSAENWELRKRVEVLEQSNTSE